MRAWTHPFTALAVSIGLAGMQPTARADLYSDIPTEIRGQVVSVVGAVGAVWTDDELLVQFHKSVADRYKDTPSLEQFRTDEQWVSAYTSRSLRFPGVTNARSKRSLVLQRGDIVRIRIENFRKVDSYFQVTTVEEVLCRKADQDFDACAARNPLAWKLKSGQEISR